VGSGEEPVTKFFLEFHPRKEDIFEHFYTLFNKPKSVFCNGNASSVPTNIISTYQLLYRHNKISSMCSTVTLTQSNQRHWVVPPPSLTKFSSDLDESHNRSLGQVGGTRSPPPPNPSRGYATGAWVCADMFYSVAVSNRWASCISVRDGWIYRNLRD